MSVISFVESSLAALVIIGAGFYFYHADGKEVIEYQPAEMAEILHVNPGEWSLLTLNVRKKRDCQLSAASEMLIFVNGEDEPRSGEVDRDGPLLMPKRGWQQGRLKFRVPIDAPPGPASVKFNAAFQCQIRTVFNAAPALEFDVLEPGG